MRARMRSAVATGGQRWWGGEVEDGWILKKGRESGAGGGAEGLRTEYTRSLLLLLPLHLNEPLDLRTGHDKVRNTEALLATVEV
jgi:hypothetical protein